jgi:hypothetical protein
MRLKLANVDGEILRMRHLCPSHPQQIGAEVAENIAELLDDLEVSPWRAM